MREQVKVKIWDWFNHEYKDEIRSKLTIDELRKIHPKYLVSKRDKGVSYMSESGYILFHTPNNLAKDIGFECGEYGVSIKDYLEVLKECPHYPNKKESKAIRQAKAKKGR